MLIVNPIEAVKAFFRKDNDYYCNHAERILEQNNRILYISCVLYLCVLLVYTISECVFDQSQLLIYFYFMFDSIHIVLTIYVFCFSRKQQMNRKKIQFLCGFFECTILVFFAIESVFPFPSLNALYFPIPILLVMLIFVHRARYVIGMILIYSVSFPVLSFFFKQPHIVVNDIRIAAATLISSLIGFALISNIRHREGLATRRLEYLGSTDELTGTYNKQTIERICKAYIADSRCAKIEGSCALIMVDLDNFKEINDKYGHNVGDAVLHSFGGMLKSSFYDKDIVGRFGGDEFIVFMVKDAGKLNEVQKKISFVLEHVAQLKVSPVQEQISCSIGIAYTDLNNKETYDELLIRADKALYAAKTNGKGQFKTN